MTTLVTHPTTTIMPLALDIKNKQEHEQPLHQAVCSSQRCVSSCAAYGRVCPCHARIAAQSALKRIQQLHVNSQLFTSNNNDASTTKFKEYSADNIRIGARLGSGGFCHVHECDILGNGDSTTKHVAIKYLKRSAMVDAHEFQHGAADLASEAYFLQALHHHPHVIQLHGIAAGALQENIQCGKDAGFFILVDRLCGKTLDDKIQDWAADQEAHVGNVLTNWWSSEYKDYKRKQLDERLRVAYSIADAMEYVHSKHIVFRDLKPDNIGFDKDGVLKLFDFGLAKELKKGQANERDLYGTFFGFCGLARSMNLRKV
jgi:serine/threonine protein kinase